MSEQDTFEKYLLSRTLWWQEVLDEMSADAVLSVINAVEAAQREVASQLEADALGLIQLEDWQRAQDNAFNAWADEILAGAKASVTGTISEAFIATATASLAAYSSILSLDERARNVQTVGLSTEQIRSWFQNTPLGNAGLETWVDKAFDNGVKDKLLSALRESGVLGEGTADAVARVMRAASDAGFQITQRDAISLTRTFIQTANVNAQEAVYAANESLFRGYKRVETLDTRTCAACALADGSEYGLDEERPRLPAHPRCVVGETPIYAPDYIAAFVSTYCGPVVDIAFATGARCSVTPNHMFLTRDGFTPAKSLREGSNVFCSSREVVSDAVHTPYNNGKPTSIKEVVEAFAETSGVATKSVPLASEDLHGDGQFTDGKVHVIAPDCLLRGDYETFFREFLGKEFFAPAAKLPQTLNRQRFFPLSFLRLWHTLGCHVSGLSIFEVFLRASLGHHQGVGFCVGSQGNPHFLQDGLQDNSLASVPLAEFSQRHAGQVELSQFVSRNPLAYCSGRQAKLLEPPYDCITGDAKLLRHLSVSLKGVVSSTQVVSINVRDFSGHVYDLQTVSSLYEVDGIITSNCRGVYVPIAKSWRDFGFDVDDLEEVARPWTIREQGPIGVGGRKIENYGKTTENFEGWWRSLSEQDKARTSIGPTRRKLLESGQVAWADLWDKSTGRPRTLAELGFDREGNRL